MKIDHAIADGVGLLDVLFNIVENGGDSPRKLLDSGYHSPRLDFATSQAVEFFASNSKFQASYGEATKG